MKRPARACNGSGQTGLVGDECKLCKGNGFVTEAKATAYRNKYQLAGRHP
jgi:DnaJ-class molecular chaperone